MNKAVTIACAVVFGALIFATPKLEAQFPQPPSIGAEPPQFPDSALPSRDVSADVDRMTTRYGLSDDEAIIVRAILAEKARKADELAKDNSISPQEKLPRILTIKDEEIRRVSDALTPEQRKKYLADVRPAPPPMNSPEAGAASSAPAKQ